MVSTPHTQSLLLPFTGGHTHVLGWKDGPPWEGRLVVGCEYDLMAAVMAGGFSPVLHDCLDKVRVELDVPMRGVA